AAGMPQEHELQWSAQVLDYQGPCHEIHVLDNVWTVLVGMTLEGDRIALSAEDIAGAIAMLVGVLWKAGKLGGRIGVCEPKMEAADDDRKAVLEAGVRLAISRG